MKVENSVKNNQTTQKNHNYNKNYQINTDNASQQSSYFKMNNQDVYMGYPEKSRQNIYIGADNSNIDTEKSFHHVNTKVDSSIYEGYPDKSRYASNSSSFEKTSSTNVHFSYPRQKRGSVYTGSNHINSNYTSVVENSSPVAKKTGGSNIHKTNTTYSNDNITQSKNTTVDKNVVLNKEVKNVKWNRKLILTLNLTVIALVLIIVAPSFTLFASVLAIVLSLFTIISKQDKFFMAKICLVASAVFTVLAIVKFVL